MDAIDIPIRSDEDLARARTRRATLALVLACAFWGGSFTWTKSATDAVNAACGLSSSGAAGPLLLLGWRFILAGAIWFFFMPRARAGWTWLSVRHSLILGAFNGVGMLLQTLGLTRTTEAVSAFLTSLTILFVPLILIVAHRKLPPLSMVLVIAIAVAGIWLMTGGTPTGFGVGELLGVLCSIVFSFHLILINIILPRDTPWRMVGGQFVVIGLAYLVGSYLFVPQSRPVQAFFSPFGASTIIDLLLLVVIAGIGATGLMVFFQPRLEATRAALVYLTEPIFAAGYAYIAIGRKLSSETLLGAGLILLANLLVEVIEIRRKRRVDRTMREAGV